VETHAPATQFLHRARFEYASAFDHVILHCAAPRNRFVMPDDLTNNKGKESLGNVRVELADSRELTQNGLPAWPLFWDRQAAVRAEPCNLPTARVHRNRSANMWTIAASMLSILSRMSRRFELGSTLPTSRALLSR
jgi:hypothetical protein